MHTASKHSIPTNDSIVGRFDTLSISAAGSSLHQVPGAVQVGVDSVLRGTGYDRMGVIAWLNISGLTDFAEAGSRPGSMIKAIKDSTIHRA